MLLQLRWSHVLRPRHWTKPCLPLLGLTIRGEVHKAHLSCDVLIVLHDGGLARDVSIHHEGVYIDVEGRSHGLLEPLSLVGLMSCILHIEPANNAWQEALRVSNGFCE